MLPIGYNQLHVYARESNGDYGHHFGLDLKENGVSSFYKINSIVREYRYITPPGPYSQMIFVNDNLFLLSDGTHGSRDIFRYRMKQTSDDWRLCNLMLPEKMSFQTCHQCIVAFNNVVIIFEFDKNGSIYRWYLDLGDIDQNKELDYDNYEWIGNKIEGVNNDTSSIMRKDLCCCVLDKSQSVHFFYPYQKKTYHKAVKLLKLIPMELCKKYNATLIFGYIRTIQGEFELSYDVPQGVAKLIIAFYA